MSHGTEEYNLLYISKKILQIPCFSVELSTLAIFELWSFTLFYTSVQIFINLLFLFIYLFGVLRHCTGHITMGSWKGRGNQY